MLSSLSKKTLQSPLRKASVSEMTTFQWTSFTDDLAVKTPNSHHILSSVVVHSDSRNRAKVDTTHFLGICMTAAVLLKKKGIGKCAACSQLFLCSYITLMQRSRYY